MAEWFTTIASAVEKSGLKNGDRISFHHHLRLGDRVVEQVLQTLAGMGFRDLTLCASSLMGCAGDAVLEAVRRGTIVKIETTGLKEPLSSAVIRGEIPQPVIFRSHGGRAQAIISGRTPVDVAFLAASAVDREGNANGTGGPNRFGSLGYGMVDAEHARFTIVVTDHIEDLPLSRTALPAEWVDAVLTVPSIGEKEEMSGGSLRKSRRPVEQLIARRAVEILSALGVVKKGFNFQAGSGGVSLLVSEGVADLMRSRGICGGFASGGATGTLASLLEEGLFQKLYDVQSFDDEAALSLEQNPNHREMSASLYANPDHPDCIAHKLDLMILSATEVDCDFNINSITGSDGRILGALGGAPDTAAGSSLTMAVLPSFRGRIPTIRRRVNTICTPGKDVDLIVTERGFCVNPIRKDLQKSLVDGGFTPLKPEDLMSMVHRITGAPEYPEKGDAVAGIVEYRDGSLLDRIYRRG
jgi:citrate lyase subunit alpha/citrate CoA-transferase